MLLELGAIRDNGDHPTTRRLHELGTRHELGTPWTLVVTPQFDDAGRFSEGLAPVLVCGQWGFIDTSGNIVITPQFDYAYHFSEGLAAVQVDGKWGYISK